MDLNWLDTLEFKAIPAQYNDVPELTVNVKGHMSMKQAFQRKMRLHS